MSDHLPDLSMGSRVRIMQTTAMERRGLANRRGTYTGLGYVILDGTMDRVQVGLASLMRITPEQELRWAKKEGAE